MLTRRLFAAATVASFATGAVSQEVFPLIGAPAPPKGPDAYGLRAFVKAPEWMETLLREFGEPALLPMTASTPFATYRLLEGGRHPRCARVIFSRLSGGATIVMKQRRPQIAGNVTVGGRTLTPEMRAALASSPFTSTSSLDAHHGARMRVLLDDEDRFWNGATEPPEWEQMSADDEHAILVTSDGWSAVLEARVGSKRHVIVRSSPKPDEWLGQISEGVFGRRAV